MVLRQLFDLILAFLIRILWGVKSF
jgi:hypothetical protein